MQFRVISGGNDIDTSAYGALCNTTGKEYTVDDNDLKPVIELEAHVTDEQVPIMK